MDYIDIGVWRKEIKFIKVSKYSRKEMEEISRIAQVFHLQLVDYNKSTERIKSVR